MWRGTLELIVDYKVIDRSESRVVFRKELRTETNLAVASQSNNINELFRLNIEQLVKDPEFMQAIND